MVCAGSQGLCQGIWLDVRSGGCFYVSPTLKLLGPWKTLELLQLLLPMGRLGKDL